MKINFNIVKYLFITLYVLLIASILLISRQINIGYIGHYIIAFIFITSLILVFIPIKQKKIGYYKYKHSKVIPIIIFSFMLAILVFSINFTLAEFFDGNYFDLVFKIFESFYFYIILLVIWIIFTVIGIILNLKKEVDNFYKKYLITLISGSLLELIITIPLHIFILKRKECLVGIVSIFGVLGGFIVLIFVMGPSIFLFLVYFYNKFNRKENSKITSKNE